MKRTTILWSAGVAAALFAGVGIGSTTAPPPEVRTETRTVTKNVPGPTKTVTKTETKTVTKEVTPESCLEALDLADKGFQFTVRALENAQAGFEAISNLDMDAVDDITRDMNDLNSEMEGVGDQYVAAKTECRSK